MAAKKDDALTREGAGNWRTKDGRFLIRGESGGHWYLIDDLRRDPFGLELVSGPYATVAAAREAIARGRADFPEGSAAPEPTAPPDIAPSRATSKRGGPAATRRRPGPVDGQRHAPARAAPSARVEPAARASGEARAKASALPRKWAAAKPASRETPAAAKQASPESVVAADPAPPPAAAEPSEPAWMEALPPAGRRAARRSMEVLDRLGVGDAGEIVRRDLTTDAPEVARAMLLQRVAAIIAEAPDPAAARAIAADILRLLTVAGRAADRARGIPGWHLVETRTDLPGRRIELEADDLDAALDRGQGDASERQTPDGR